MTEKNDKLVSKLGTDLFNLVEALGIIQAAKVKVPDEILAQDKGPQSHRPDDPLPQAPPNPPEDTGKSDTTKESRAPTPRAPSA